MYCKVLHCSLRIILVLLFLFCSRAASGILDDFREPVFNNIGEVRSGQGRVYVMVTYPRQGIVIPSEDDFLIETLVPEEESLNVADKSLRINYTAFSSGSRPIKYLSNGDYSYVIDVPFEEGRHHIVIPLTHFSSANLKLGQAIGIGGPLFVHMLELVKTTDTLASAVPLSLVENKGHGHPTDIYHFPLRQIESPYMLQFMEYKDTQHGSPMENLNSLGFRRDGLGISKVVSGIEIEQDGFLFETLVAGSERIDLRNNFLRLTLSAPRTATSIYIKAQYHQDSVINGSVSTSIYEMVLPENFKLPASSNVTTEIAFDSFPSFRSLDVKSISVSGPAFIHRIELVKQMEYPHPLNRLMGPYKTTVLIDDLSNWPDTLGPSRMVINWVQDFFGNTHLPGYINGLPGSGFNNFDYTCMGSGVSIAEEGITLANEGFIYEQISSRYGVFDLSNARLEINYSAKRLVTRRLKVLTVVPDDTGRNFHIQPVYINCIFPPGREKTVLVSVKECGPSHGFFITGHGEVTLRSIQLHLPYPGWRFAVRSVVLDNFMDWPLTVNSAIMIDPSISIICSDEEGSTTPISHGAGFQSGSNRSTIFDYRHSCLQSKFTLRNCNCLAGQGIVIRNDGRLSQQLPLSKGMNMVIAYSASYAGTRKITALDYIQGSFYHNKLYVMFNNGVHQEVVVPLNDISNFQRSVSLLKILIYGPLIVHEVRFLDIVQPVVPLPGQHLADALLIDDFSDFSPRNNFGLGLHSANDTHSGSMTLHSFDEYLMESIAGEWELRYMQFRITYTAEQSESCKMSLIPELRYGWFGRLAPYDPDSVHFEDIEFDCGTKTTKTVSVFDLRYNRIDSYSPFHGLVIHGPTGSGARTNRSLVIHRIEIMPRGPFSFPMKPSQRAFPSRRTGRMVPSQSRLGLIPDHSAVVVDNNRSKLDIFKSQLATLRNSEYLPVPISREHLWRDTFHFNDLSPQECRKTLRIDFLEERGQDEGGLTREFFTLVANAMYEPEYALFTTLAEANYALQINPNSMIHEDIYLKQFKVIGRIIGMAILSESLMGIRLVPSLYRKLIEEAAVEKIGPPELLEHSGDWEIDISELEAIEPDIYANLNWCLVNDISELTELTMSLEQPFFDTKVTIDLVKNGRHHTVTEANKKQYVLEYARWHLIGKVEAQANAFRDGVWDIVPQKFLSAFNVTELELLIAGISTIDLSDWVNNTEYRIGYHENHPVIKDFWQCVAEWDNEKRVKLLQFVTGSPCIPSTGFVGLKYKFAVSPVPAEILYPRACTCFNILKLPPFPNIAVMRERLEVAIRPEMAHFTFA